MKKLLLPLLLLSVAACAPQPRPSSALVQAVVTCLICSINAMEATAAVQACPRQFAIKPESRHEVFKTMAKGLLEEKFEASQANYTKSMREAGKCDKLAARITEKPNNNSFLVLK